MKGHRLFTNMAAIRTLPPLRLIERYRKVIKIDDDCAEIIKCKLNGMELSFRGIWFYKLSQ